MPVWLRGFPHSVFGKVRDFASDSRGATAIEYGLIVAGITLAIIAVVFTLGTEINNVFSDAQTRIQGRGK